MRAAASFQLAVDGARPVRLQDLDVGRASAKRHSFGAETRDFVSLNFLRAQQSLPLSGGIIGIWRRELDAINLGEHAASPASAGSA
jgi:hypothetical protein